MMQNLCCGTQWFLSTRASIAIAHISYDNSVHPSVRDNPVPIQVQVRKSSSFHHMIA